MPNFRAGDLIDSGAVATCLRAWYEHGANASAWTKVRRYLRELFPEARTNSIEAVIAIVQQGRRASKPLCEDEPEATCKVNMIPDARRLLRDARRKRTTDGPGPD